MDSTNMSKDDFGVLAPGLKRKYLYALIGKPKDVRYTKLMYISKKLIKDGVLRRNEGYHRSKVHILQSVAPGVAEYAFFRVA